MTADNKTSISRGADGKYRWTYEMSVLTNPTIFLTIWKIFAIISAGIFAIIFLANIGHADRLLGTLKFCVIFFAGMTAMVWLGCLVYSLMIGGKYRVEFEMDENGIIHRQSAEQAEKLKNAMKYSVRYRTMTRTELSSDFSKVRKVKAYPRLNVIKLNEPFAHNQVYASDEDFEFVRQFIVSRCTNLK